ncbi:MAG: DUF134 domain-containing protein [Lachnospiraceae bacterium]|nr:DUF134 domain-containing protein [Lachnospiraceae bacterium]
MPRPQRNRKICTEPRYKAFAPVEKKNDEKIDLSCDEYETIRLIDLVGLTQEQCARHMGVSRTTVTQIYDNARSKLADMLINGRTLNITGGNYSVCNGHDPEGTGELCSHCMSELNIQKGTTQNVTLIGNQRS